MIVGVLTFIGLSVPSRLAAEEGGFLKLKESRDRICYLSGGVRPVGEEPRKGAEALNSQVRRYFDDVRNLQQCKEALESYCKAAVLGQGRRFTQITSYYRSVRPEGERTELTLDPDCKAKELGTSGSSRSWNPTGI